MGRLVYALITAFAIELGLYLFSGANYTQSTLFGLLLDPSNLPSSSLYLVIFGALAAIGASVIVIGTFWNINIYGIYAGMALAFLSFILVIVHLWVFINGQLSELITANSSIIATIITTPFLLAYMIILADYVRGNE